MPRVTKIKVASCKKRSAAVIIHHGQIDNVDNGELWGSFKFYRRKMIPYSFCLFQFSVLYTEQTIFHIFLKNIFLINFIVWRGNK